MKLTKNNQLKLAGQKALAIVLSVAMVMQGSPIAYALEEDSLDVEIRYEQPAEEGQLVESLSADDQAAAAQQEEPQADALDAQDEVEVAPPASIAQVQVGLSLDHAFITCNGVTAADPTATIGLPENSDAIFVAAAEEGYRLSEVKVLADGQESVLSPDGEGRYTLQSSLVGEGTTIVVTTEQDTPQAQQHAEARNTQDTFTYEDDSVKVTARLSDPSALPEGVSFVVTPISSASTDYNYDAYLQALNDDGGDQVTYTSKNTLLYDVAFLVPKTDDQGNQLEGQQVEVQLDMGNVDLSFEFKKDQLASGIEARADGGVQIRHLPLTDDVREANDTTAAATDISAQDINVQAVQAAEVSVADEQASFKLDSMSVVAISNLLAQTGYPVTVRFVDAEGNLQASPALQGNTVLFVKTDHQASQWNRGAYFAKLPLQQEAEHIYAVDSLIAEWGTDPTDALVEGDTVQSIQVVKVANDGIAPGNYLADWGGNVAYGDGDTVDGYHLSIEMGDAEAVVTFAEAAAPLPQDPASPDAPPEEETQVKGFRLGVESEGVTVPEGSYYALVSYTYNWQRRYSLQKIDFGSNSVTGIPTFWDAGGWNQIDYVPGQDVTVELVKAKGSALSLSEAVYGNNCVKIADGQLLGNNLFATMHTTDGATILLTPIATGEAVANTTTITFVDDEGALLQGLEQTPVTDSLTAVATLSRSGKVVAWAVKPVSAEELNESATTSVTFDSFEVCDAAYSPTGDTVQYDPSAFALDVRLYHGTGQLANYAATANASTSLAGYDCTGSVVSEDGSTTTITYVKQYDKGLSVRISLSPAGTIQAQEKVFLVVQAKNACAEGDAFYIQRLEAKGESTLLVPITKWVDHNGNELADVQVPTNANDLIVRLARANNDSISPNDIYTGQHTYQLLQDGASVGNYTLAYGQLQQSVGDATRTKSYIQDISLRGAWTVMDAVDYVDVLGNARYFGIVAREWNINGDAETNAAVQKAYCSSQSGNDLVNSTSGVMSDRAQPWFVGEVANNSRLGIKGEDADVYAPSSNWNSIVPLDNVHIRFHEVTKEQVDAYVQAMLDHGASMSAQLASRSSLADGAQLSRGSDQKLTLDFTAYGPGTIYVPLDTRLDNGQSVLEFMGAQSENLTIKKNSDQTIVLSSNTSGQVMLNKFKVVNDGESYTPDQLFAGKNEVYDAIVSQIVWNFPNATQVRTAGSTAGIFLMPRAHFEVDSTSCGWIVADSVKNNSGEWHNIWQRYDQEYEKIDAYVSAHKSLEGAALGAGQFAFELRDADENVIQTVANDAEGNVRFSAFAFDRAGTYTYTIREVLPAGVTDANPTSNGITYDTTVYTVTVTVTSMDQNYTNKKLSVSTTYGTADGTPLPEAPTFVNRQGDDATVDLQATKVWDDNGAQEASHPAVTLHLLRGVGDGEQQVVPGQDRTIPADATGDDLTVTWEELPKSQDGVDIAYAVAEEPLEGYASVITGDAASGYVVTNTRDEATATIEVAKNFNEWSKAGEQGFAFTLTAQDAKDAEGNELDIAATMPAEDGTHATTMADAPTASFGTLTFTKPGTYRYAITEDAASPADPNIAYDTSTHTATVTVSRGEDGKLAARVRYDQGGNAAVFTNTYTYHATGELVLTATKTLQGSALSEGQFAFELSGEDIQRQTKRNGAPDKDGVATVTFDAITYDQDDLGKTFTYTVREIDAHQAGITCDDTVYTATVTLSDDGKGTLTPQVAYTTGGDGEAAADAIAFANTYRATGSVQLVATKSLQGHELEKGQFSFELRDADGTVLQTKANGTAKNGQSALVRFDPITYTQADAGKTFSYTINEVDDGAAGYSYDLEPRTVTVDVTDNGDGTLAATVTQDSDELAFANGYEATGSVVLRASKTLDGEAPQADAFQFELVDAATGAVLQTKTNDAQGKIAFDALTYRKNAEQDDTQHAHRYLIREKHPSKADDGLAYDTTVYTAVVTLVDDGSGNLQQTVAYTHVDADGNTKSGLPLFDNHYRARGSLTITGVTKQLKGKSLADSDAFAFEVREGDVVVATGNSTASGEVVFSPITYAKDAERNDEGTHTYTIGEVVGDKSGITYDERTYSLVVQVTDNGEGDLVATPARGSKLPMDVSFVNTYDATGSVVLGGTKHLTGRTLEEGQFSFELTDDQGKVLQTVTNHADGSFAFEPISYGLADAGKTFEYVVYEVVGDAAGYAYDEHEEHVSVAVSDNGDGTLRVEPSTNHLSMTFSNAYAASDEARLVARKTLEGADLAAGAFSFWLRDANGNLLQTVACGSDGVAAFEPLAFTQADAGKTFIYQIGEVLPEGVDKSSPTLAGMTYDTHVEQVEIAVADNGDGTLSVTYDGEDAYAGASFSNQYVAAGEVALVAHKQLTGGVLKEGQFAFELRDASGAVLQQKHNDATGAVTFDTMSYGQRDAGKTFEYVIAEVNEGAAGYSYDQHEERVTVTVADNGDGTLAATASYDEDGATFTNAYEAAGSVVLAGTKLLTGRKLQRDQFSFDLVSAEGEVLQRVTNDANGSFSFDPISYTQQDAGRTFAYTIREVVTNEPGYSYDGHVEEVVVQVSDKGDGILEATASYDVDGAVFKNGYAATGEAQLFARKSLEGADLATGAFSFWLRDANGKLLQSVANDADGLASFDPITYTQADAGKTFVYTIGEAIPELAEGTPSTLAGITYDAHVEHVEVAVVDNGDGTLAVTYNGKSEFGGAEFANSYAASGQVALVAHKSLTGRALQEGQFSFELRDATGALVQQRRCGADGMVAFDPIAYTASDAGKTFAYTIAEVDEGAPGYRYDAHVERVEVTVADKGDGSLVATVTYDADGATFANTYEATGSVTLGGSKRLSGRKLEEGQFSFELVASDGQVLQTVANAADGSFAFEPVAYTLADAGKTFEYVVREVDTHLPGYSYDRHTERVTVTVSDAGDGTLLVEPSANHLSLSFSNGYAAHGEARLSARKMLEGADLAAGAFSFWLKDDEGQTVQVKAIDAQGVASFDPVLFTQDDAGKTFTYTIGEVLPQGVTEDNATAAGITYDTHVQQVKIAVADNGDGTLAVTYDGKQEFAADTFTNSYAASGEVVLLAQKSLMGHALQEGQFVFELRDANGSLVQRKRNDANGAVSFDPLAYGQDDVGKTFAYTISEVAGNAAGYTYDEHVEEVTVEVADNADGTLTATATYDADGATFVNAYDAAGSVTFEATKTLAGRPLVQGQFQFELAGEGMEPQVKSNDAQGAIVFDPIAYTLDDAGKTFTYTIREVAGDEPGYAYDPTTYVATVRVTDNGAGGLTTDVSYEAVTDGKAAPAEGMTFANTYDAKGEATIRAHKTLQGCALAAGDCCFELRNESGDVIATAYNGADGQVEFPPLTFGLADAGGEFAYTIAEVTGDNPSIVYDEHQERVLVRVAQDDGSSVLATEVVYDQDGAEFVNEYRAAGAARLFAQKRLANHAIEAGAFQFALYEGQAAEGEPLQVATVDAQGRAHFKPLAYTQADAGKTFAYTITEVVPEGAERDASGAYVYKGVTYDASAHTVRVQVTDLGDGALSVGYEGAPLSTQDGAGVVFVNSYAAQGTATFQAVKTLNGKAPQAGEYQFKLTGVGVGEDMQQVVSNDADGVAAFTPITFTLDDLKSIDADGTITYPDRELAYTISEVLPEGIDEQNPTDGGLTYDTHLKVVKVVLHDQGDGTIAISYDGEPSLAPEEFANTYKASGEVQLKAHKTLSGHELSEGQFAFELYELVDGKEELLQTATNAADGTVAFEPIGYEKGDEGVHHYAIAEKNDGAEGYTYDDAIRYVDVTVTDNGDGTLAATTDATQDALTFANSYEAAGEVKLTATKVLEGQTLEPGAFAFQVSERDEVMATGTNDADGNVTFSPISFTKQGDVDDTGDHQYVVSEVIPAGATDNGDGTYTLAGVTYDAQSTTVHVTVSDRGNGKLAVKGAKDGVLDTGVTFTNRYRATGEVQLRASKQLEGAPLHAGEFAFLLKDANGNVLQTVTNGGMDARGEALPAGEVAFAPLAYDSAGTYHYTICEVEPPMSARVAGVSYDAHEIDVTVTVTDAGDGSLGAIATYSGAPTFTNTYAASGSARLYATKTVNGSAPAADAYSFELVGEDGKVIETKGNDARGRATFSRIHYTLDDVGSHTYTIREVVPQDAVNAGGVAYADASAAVRAAGGFAKAGVTYDTHEQTVVVNVSDAGDGTLLVRYDGHESFAGAAFANAYTATGRVRLRATKTLGDQAPAAGQFAFALYEGAQAKGTPISVVTNDETGKALFRRINYKLDDVGTHEYTIVEAIPEGAQPDGNGNYTLGGYTYDGHAEHVSVTVTDAGDGTLQVAAAYDSEGGATFANAYEADGTAQLYASKTLNGTAPQAGRFSFELRDESGALLQTVANDPLGITMFEPLAYTLDDVGVHRYTIREQLPAGVSEESPTLAGVTYDTHVQEVAVNVEDAGDGTLRITYGDDGSQAFGGAAFANTYQTRGTFELSGHKVIEGRDFMPGDRLVFVATAVEVDGQGDEVGAAPARVVPDPVTVESGDGAQADISFAPVEFNRNDIGKNYRYTVRERIESGSGMTADEFVHTATVHISDRGDGALQIASTYSDGDALALTNTYQAAGEARLFATKRVEGRDLEAGQFAFQLADADGAVLQVVRNDAAGRATFAPLAYTLDDVGDHTYTISEVNEGRPGYAYDEHAQTVTVHVADKGDGTLAVTYAKGEQTFAGAAFTNAYEASGEAKLAVRKSLGGQVPQEGTFSFRLLDEAGNEQVVANDANGLATFEPIAYTLKDVGTHEYVISEVLPDGVSAGNPTLKGVTYDVTEHKVVVTVADAGNGELRVSYDGVSEITDNTGILGIFNGYVASTSISLRALKQLEGRDWHEGESFQMLLDPLDEDARNKTPEPLEASTTVIGEGEEARHAATFVPITFTLQDLGKTFTYRVSESFPGSFAGTPEHKGVTYDVASYTVTFEVPADADNGDGTLKVDQSITRGNEQTDAIVFTNTYQGKSAFASLLAHKQLEGREAKRGEFTFELRLANGDQGLVQTQRNGIMTRNTGVTVDLEDPTEVAFDQIEYLAAGTYDYVLREVPPASAVNASGVTYGEATSEQRAAGGFVLDGVTYDATEHRVSVVVTDDGEGQLTAKVIYADDKEPTFTNTFFDALSSISFNKAFFGAHPGTFAFTLTAADESFEPRAGARLVYGTDHDYDNEPLVDIGQAFSMALQTGEFNQDGVATVEVPAIRYRKPGTYHYVIAEDELDSTVTGDLTKILVAVDVAEDGTATTSYALRPVEGDEIKLAENELPMLYNNEAVHLEFRSRALRANSGVERIASFMPQVRKVLRNGSLSGGEFTFELHEGEQAAGDALQVVTNDENGAVAFQTLVYRDADVGEHVYTIVERRGSNSAISYDVDPIRLIVTVAEGEDGKLTAQGVYQRQDEDGAWRQTDEPTIQNDYSTIRIHAVKRSRQEPYEPLAHAHYGLWMVNPGGSDVYIGADESDENGNLYYNIPVLEGVAYYFLEEEPPPAGHLIDPYRTDYFTLVKRKNNTFYLVYENGQAEDGRSFFDLTGVEV